MIINNTKRYTYDAGSLTESFDTIYPSRNEIELSRCIARDIIKLNDTPDDYTHILSIDNQPAYGVIKIRYENTVLPFTDNLNVYVSCNSKIEEIATLSNSYYYEYDEKNDKFIKKQEDITITERYTDAPQMIEVMSDGKYSEISLLFVFAKDCPYSLKDLSFIIRHEFVHIKDTLETQLSHDKLNALKMISQAANALKKKATPNSLRLFDYLQQNAEYLLPTELGAYVTIVMKELSDIPSKDILNIIDKTDNVITSFLYQLSKTFNFFYDMRQQILLSKYVMNAVEKRNFTDLFIGRVFSPIQSFDNFIDSIVSNIDTIFIANCIKYLKHCKAIIEHRMRPITPYGHMHPLKKKLLLESTVAMIVK